MSLEGTVTEDEQVKRLIQVRRGNRSAITKLEKEVQTAVEKQKATNSTKVETELLTRLNSISQSLKQKQSYIKQLDDKIIESIHLDYVSKEVEESLDWETKIYQVIYQIEQLKEGNYVSTSQITENTVSSQPPTDNPSPSAPQEQPEELPNQSFSSSQNNSVSLPVGIRLPKLELLKFNGEITQFNAFWQSFECAIHSNENLSGIHKLNYLVNLLEGPAYRVVAGLSLTEENYEHAVQTLRDRFGNKQRIISAHMQSLLKLQDCPCEKVSQLRYIYDNINVHVRGLEALGMPQESYGSLLIPIIMQRMPSEITIQVARKVTEDVWPIKEILEIIKKEIEAREMGICVATSDKKTAKPTNQPRQPATTQAFFTKEEQRRPKAGIQCYLCSKGHLSINCKQVTDIAARKEILQQAKRCFKCLKLGHYAKSCAQRCRKCGGGHHQLICKGKTQAPQDRPTEEDSSDRLLTATVKEKKQVLLQTAQAIAFGEDSSKAIPVCILFDGGSQRSYITDELKKKLKLQVESTETLNINTFGSEKYNKKKCESVQLSIAANSQSRPVTVRALSYPSICSPLCSYLEISDYPHLRGLQLADNVASPRKRIDLLIGADHFYEFVSGEVIKGSSGPVAIKSNLGWLLSGPYTSMSESNDANINTHLVLDSSKPRLCITDLEVDQEIDHKQEISENLKTFWRHEAMGLSELTESDTSHQQNKEFQIEFNGMRYEVRLPWDSDFANELLPNNYELCDKRLRSLFAKLKGKPELLQEYDAIFQEQLTTGIIERVSEGQEKPGKIHYLCHHGVIRKDHDTTKLRIVLTPALRVTRAALVLMISSY